MAFKDDGIVSKSEFIELTKDGVFNIGKIIVSAGHFYVDYHYTRYSELKIRVMITPHVGYEKDNLFMINGLTRKEIVSMYPNFAVEYFCGDDYISKPE